MRTKPPRKLGGYFIVIGLALGIGLIGTFVLGRSYSELALQKEAFDRLQYVPSFDPIEDATLGLSPNSSNVVAAVPDPNIRALRIFPTQIIEVVGGKAIKSIDTPAPATLQALVSTVNDPTWLALSGHAVTLKAAVILQNGSSMSIAAPVITDVVMQAHEGVFLAADHAALSLSGVDVRASDSKVPTTFSRPEQTASRPFVLAVGSKLDITGSTFRYLGRDWNSSYGVSWSKGSIGSVTGSRFEHNFIGVYTNGSPRLLVQHSVFLHNSLYGIDPHSGSSHMSIIDNTSNYNGRHGIIFSDHVTAGIVRGNTTIGNGLNGIMMDEASTGNLIAGNTVTGNRSDGIVMANSSNNRIEGNTVTGNRIGITLRGSTTGTVLTQNVITNNKMAIQGGSSAGNHVRDNGGEWSAARIARVWIVSAILLLLLLILTWFSKRRPGHPPSGTGPAPHLGMAT
jgi:poly(beta-D-mannuronate) C5 epimerase